jgi:hypothetical protein
LASAIAPEDVIDVLVAHFDYHVYNLSDIGAMLVRDGRIIAVPVGIPALREHQVVLVLARAFDPPAQFTLDEFWKKLAEHCA